MSTTIDERVVEMRFDNSNFEKNVHESMSTLDKLKEKLNFSKSSEALTDLEKASSRITFGDLSSSIDGVSVKLSGLGLMATRVLTNIVDDAYSAAKAIAKSVSFDQFDAGWQKYGDKTTSVQTIIAATKDAYRDTNGLVNAVAQLDDVNYQLERLNWFTDETSYNFVDMVNNIGKFTANSVSLEDAATSMMGIANWAAISGQNATTASRAMYNLAQATGAGAVKLMDWKSIENANMATAEFKKRALEVASAMGILTKSADGTFKTLNGVTVTVENFSQTLSEGWFTTRSGSVLERVLDDYGGFANALRDAVEATDISATEFLTAIEDLQNGNADLTALAKDAGMSVEDLSEMVKYLASDTFEFGREAFKTAQEAKTLTDAIDATKDAASTAWMNVFESVFGDYNQARKTWTQMTESLWDIFVEPVDRLSGRLKSALNTTFYWDNGSLIKADEEIKDIVVSAAELNGELDLSEEQIEAMVQDWKANHEAIKGNEYVASILSNTMGLIADLLTIVREAWRSVFSPESTDYIFYAAKAMAEFLENLRPTEEQMEKMTEALSGFFAIFKPILNLLSGAVQIVGILATELGKLFLDGIKPIFSFIGSGLSDLSELGKDTTLITKGVNRFRSIIQSLFSRIRTGVGKAVQRIKEFWSYFKDTDFYKNTLGVFEEKLSSLFNKIQGYFSLGSDGSSKFFNDVKNAFSNVRSVIENVGSWFSRTFGSIRDSLVGTGDDATTLGEKVSELWTKLKENNPFESLLDGIKGLSEVKITSNFKIFDSISEFFNNIGENVRPIGKAMDTLSSSGSMSNYISTTLSNMGAGLQGFFSGITLEDAMRFIGSGALAAGVLSLGDALKKLSKTIPDVAGVFSALSSGINKLSTSAKMYLDKKGWSELGKGLLYVAGAVVLVAGAAYLLKDLDTDQLLRSVGAVAGLVAVFGGLYVALGLLSRQENGSIKNLVSAWSMAEQLKSVALVMVAAVVVLRQLEKVNYDEVIDNVKAFGIVLAEVVGTQLLLSNFSGNKGGALKFIGFAASLLVFVKVLDKLSTVNFDAIKRNLEGHLIDIALALVSFVGLYKLMSGGSGASVFKMVLLPIALLAFVNVLKKVTSIATGVDYSGLILAIGSMWLIMKMFSGFSANSNIAAVFGTLLAFGAGLYAVSLSLEKISDVIGTTSDFKSLISLLATLGAISTSLILFTKNAGKLSEKNLWSFMGVMLSFAASVAIIANALQQLSSLSAGELIGGGFAIVAIMTLLRGVIDSLSAIDMSKLSGIGKTLVGITVIVGLLSIIVDVLGQMWTNDPRSMIGGMGALGSIVVMLVMIFKSLSKIDASIKPSVLLTVAAIIAVLGGVVYALGRLFSTNIGGAAAAVVSLVAIMGLLSVLMNSVSKIHNANGLSKVMLSVAATIAAMGLVVAAMSAIIGSDFNRIWPALVALTAGIGLLVGFMAAVKAINSNMAVNTKGLLSMVGIIAAIGGVIAVLSKVMGSAGSGGFLALWPALTAVASGLFLVITALTALGALSGIISGAVNVLRGLAGVVGILAVSVGGAAALIGIGIEKIVNSLMKLKDFSDTDRENVKMAVVGILGGVTEAMEEEGDSGRVASAVGHFLGGILTALAEGIGSMLLTLVTVLGGMTEPIVSALMVLLVGLTEGLADAIDNNGDALAAAIGHLCRSVVALILRTIAGLLEWNDTATSKWLADRMYELADKVSAVIEPALSKAGSGNGAKALGMDIGKSYDEGITEGINANKESVTSSASEAVTSVETETKDGIGRIFGGIFSEMFAREIEINGHVVSLGDTISGTVSDSFADILQTIVTESENGEETVEKAGSNLANAQSSGYKEQADKNNATDASYTVSGLANSLSSNSVLNRLKNAARSMANSISQTFRSVLRIESPSKVMAENGEYVVMGLVEGIKDNMSDITSTAKSVGAKTRDALSESIMLASEMIEFGDYSNPVIRPVLDLTDVNNGMAGIMNTNPAFGLSYALAGQNASAFGYNPETELSNKIDKFTSAITSLLNSPNLGGTTNNWNISGNDPMEIAEQVILLMESEVDKKESQWA